MFYGILVRLSPSLGTPAFGGSFWWIMLTFLSQAPSAASNGMAPTPDAHLLLHTLFSHSCGYLYLL